MAFELSLLQKRICALGCSFVLGSVSKAETINFSPKALKQWRVVNDSVMGGLSRGRFHINSKNQGVFSGEVSLKNNGGFTSVRYQPKPHIQLGTQRQIIIKLKGDGKKYQFRVKSELSQHHSYAAHFETTDDDWQEITLALPAMYPVFRGRTLDLPNFNHSAVAEMRFLIANKKAENFELIIDSIIFN